MLQTNVMSGKIYPKYLRYIKNNRRFKNKKIRVNLPSKDLVNAYEIKKKEFTTQLNKEIMDKLSKIEGKEGQPKNITKPLTPLQEQILSCLESGMTRQKDIAEKLGEHSSKISFNIGYMRKKGIYVGKYGELR